MTWVRLSALATLSWEVGGGEVGAGLEHCAMG